LKVTEPLVRVKVAQAGKLADPPTDLSSKRGLGRAGDGDIAGQLVLARLFST
jgi:hypothetical protein